MATSAQTVAATFVFCHREIKTSGKTTKNKLTIVFGLVDFSYLFS